MKTYDRVTLLPTAPPRLMPPPGQPFSALAAQDNHTSLPSSTVALEDARAQAGAHAASKLADALDALEALEESGDGDSSDSSSSSDSDETEEDAIEGVGTASPGVCKECSQKCTKNWFECAIVADRLFAAYRACDVFASVPTPFESLHIAFAAFAHKLHHMRRSAASALAPGVLVCFLVQVHLLKPADALAPENPLKL